MTQIFEAGWWVSFLGTAWAWWFTCVLASLAAVPLCLRLFRGLADRGVGMSSGVGLTAITWIAWVGSQSLEGRGIWVRAALVLTGAGWAALASRVAPPVRIQNLFPATLLILIGVLRLPHERPWLFGAALLLAILSVGLWWGDLGRLKRAIGATLVPWLASQALFLAGFLYFVNVRSYVPYATFDVGLSGAEKLGNLMHLNSVMRSTSFPPADAWLLGEPTNYYYGGHLLVATVAKLTATPARLAFNLGLATIVALTLSMGFSLAYSLALPRRLPARRRIDVLRLAGLRVVRHRGLAWGLAGALAITVFGNLDAWRQLGARQSATRWSAQNLKQVDYWKSSRAIHGAPASVQEDATITEFPYFSALLGDLHPHHMALPYTIAACAACIALIRSTRRRAASEGRWLRRGAPALAAMALFWGGVFSVNIWDTIVLSVLYLLVVAAARQGVEAARDWLLLTRLVAVTAATWVVALVVNAGRPTPILFAAAPAYLAAVALAVLGPPVVRRLAPAAIRGRADLVGPAAGAVVLMAAAPAFGAALRDALAFAVAAVAASALVARCGRSPASWTARLGIVAAVGVGAGLVALPFMASFRSPLDAQTPLFTRALPPVLSSHIVRGDGPLWSRLSAASPINPFAAELRTTFLDGLAHWGLFVLPLTAFLAWALNRRRARHPEVVGVAAVLLVVAAVWYVALGYWMGALAFALAAGFALLAFTSGDAFDRPTFLLAATGFFWIWFVEVLHFDDSYGGTLERYNTPFKIFYPVWPMMAAATVAAVRRLAPPVPTTGLMHGLLRSPGFWTGASTFGLVTFTTTGAADGARVTLFVVVVGTVLALLATAARRGLENAWRGHPPGVPKKTRRGTRRRPALAEAPALVAAFALGLLGLLYPFAATAVRTRSFFSESINGTWMDDPNGERDRAFYTVRTLDGFAWLGQTKRYADDLPAIEWLNDHAPAGSVVVEAPSEGAYTPAGRVASMTGLPTLVGWKHHENQWRGWGKPMPASLQRRFFDQLAPQLPPLAPVLSAIEPGLVFDRAGELSLYRASLDAPVVFRRQIENGAPRASAERVRALEAAIVQARDRTLTAVAFTEKLHESGNAIYRSPILGDDIRRLFDAYGVRYVFVGAVEREAFPAEALAKFEALPKVFSRGRATVYCAASGGCPESGSPAGS